MVWVGWSEIKGDFDIPVDIACHMSEVPPHLQNEREGHENILAFVATIERAGADLNFVFCNSLLHFSTEMNIRTVIAKVIIAMKVGQQAYFVERRSPGNSRKLHRALRCLGLAGICDVFETGINIVIKVQGVGTVGRPVAWELKYPEKKERITDNILVSRIGSAIRGKLPFAFIRFIHCEVKCLGYGEYYGKSDVIQTSRLQWGGDISDSEAIILKSRLMYAVSRPDVIAVNDRSFFSADSLRVIENSALPILVDNGMDASSVEFTGLNSHLMLGVSDEFLDSLSSAARLVIVSSRPELVVKLERALGARGRIFYVPVPGEHRTEGSTSLSVSQRFAEFDAVQSILESLIRPGTVVLVGAGVVGKYWCARVKDLGGVALDLGSVLDGWAGLDTRGSGFPLKLKQMLDKRDLVND